MGVSKLAPVKFSFSILVSNMSICNLAFLLMVALPGAWTAGMQFKMVLDIYAIRQEIFYYIKVM